MRCEMYLMLYFNTTMRRGSAVKHKPTPRQMSSSSSCTRLERTQLSLPRPVEEFDTMSTITKQYQFAVNNEGLLLSEGSVNPVPKLRSTRQRDGRSRNGVYDVPQGRSNQRTEQIWYDREYNNKWQMDQAVMDAAMSINLV